MISVAEALAKVTHGVGAMPAEQVALADALGRVLAEDVAARMTQPPVAVSAMDGYAVRAEDVATVPTTLTRIGESAAGNGFDGEINTGEAVRIFTGAPVPRGANAIVIQENTEASGDTVTVLQTAPENKFIRPAGLDFAHGDVLLQAGKRLSARDLGLAAAMNVPWVMVRRKPRVAILATGDELVMPGSTPGPAQIISSNSVALCATVRTLGGEPIDLGIARDNEDSLKTMLDGARGADMLVTIGGASVGDHDLVGKVLGDAGVDLGFYKVAMRPGKPLIFGHLAGVPVLGLPGNPVSVGVTSAIFLKAAMQKMLGDNASDEIETAVLGEDVGANDERQDYLRATLTKNAEGAWVATPFDKQDSAMLARFAQAHCLVIRAPQAGALKSGERVDIIRLDQGPLAS